MLPRATSIDRMVAGSMVGPVRYEAAAINQPMQDTILRPDVVYSSAYIELENNQALEAENNVFLELEDITIAELLEVAA